MPGFTVENDNGGLGFTDHQALINALITDLDANGFTLQHPASITGSTFAATFEASATVDPLAATQPWRIRIDADGTDVKVFAATPTQLDDSGNTVADPERSGFDVGELSHVTGQSFIPTGKVSPATPFSYRLSITDRGVMFIVWQHADSENRDFSWCCVQRPVNNATGATLVTGKAPVFCVFHNMGVSQKRDEAYPEIDLYWLEPTPGVVSTVPTKMDEIENDIYKFIVRESDIFRPSLPVSATRHSPDSAAVINGNQQISITEDNQYVVTFPSGLNTSRYAYTEELDMLAYTSGDVISQWSEAQITVYGEGTPRSYLALQHNLSGRDPRYAPKFGVRMLILIDGGGISP